MTAVLCMSFAMFSGVSAAGIMLVSYLWRQQRPPMQLHLKHSSIASHLPNVPLSLPLLTVQLRFQ